MTIPCLEYTVRLSFNGLHFSHSHHHFLYTYPMIPDFFKQINCFKSFIYSEPNNVESNIYFYQKSNLDIALETSVWSQSTRSVVLWWTQQSWLRLSISLIQYNKCKNADHERPSATTRGIRSEILGNLPCSILFSTTTSAMWDISPERERIIIYMYELRGAPRIFLLPRNLSLYILEM